MDEAQLVQNTNGTIIANMRWRGSPTQGRGVALSTDGGATFSSVRYVALPVHCQHAHSWRCRRGQIC